MHLRCICGAAIRLQWLRAAAGPALHQLALQGGSTALCGNASRACGLAAHKGVKVKASKRHSTGWSRVRTVQGGQPHWQPQLEMQRSRRPPRRRLARCAVRPPMRPGARIAAVALRLAARAAQQGRLRPALAASTACPRRRGSLPAAAAVATGAAAAVVTALLSGNPANQTCHHPFAISFLHAVCTVNPREQRAQGVIATGG
jgi:hypothetical protein